MFLTRLRVAPVASMQGVVGDDFTGQRQGAITLSLIASVVAVVVVSVVAIATVITVASVVATIGIVSECVEAGVQERIE
jgi:hypothetical protein